MSVPVQGDPAVVPLQCFPPVCKCCGSPWFQAVRCTKCDLRMAPNVTRMRKHTERHEAQQLAELISTAKDLADDEPAAADGAGSPEVEEDTWDVEVLDTVEGTVVEDYVVEPQLSTQPASDDKPAKKGFLDRFVFLRFSCFNFRFSQSVHCG